MSISEQKVKHSQQENQTKENEIIGKPYQSINIGPINNDFLIPTKIKSPFEDEPDETDQNIKNIIEPFFSKNPPKSFSVQNFRIISIYASSEQRKNICDSISSTVANFASLYSQELLAMTDKSIIIQKCVEIMSSILNFTNFFEFIQIGKPFSETFYQILHIQICQSNDFINMLSSIVSEILVNSLKENKFLTLNEQYIILFCENTNLFTNPFIALITKNISTFFNEIITQGDANDKNSMKAKYRLLFKSLHILYKSIPKDAVKFLKLISKPFTIEVIRKNADSFISSVGEDVFYNQDQIDTFFAVIDPATPITDYTLFVKSMISEEINMEKMANLHRFIGKQSIHMRHIVERFLKKRLSGNGKQAIISFANLIDQEFRSGKYDTDIISEMSLIQDKFGFEAAHSAMMMRRAIDTDFELDKRFAQEYNEFYNDNHSENFMSIVKDVEGSNSLFQNFLKEKGEVPPFLSIHVFFWQNWKIDDYAKYQFPGIIQPHLTNFALFMKEKNPKKQLSWHLSASDTTLKLGKFSISCNGVTGSVLLTLNDSPKTVDQIKQILNSSDFDPEIILSQFLEQKGGCIVKRYVQNGQTLYAINTSTNLNEGDDVNISTKLTTSFFNISEEDKNKHMNFLNIISKTTQIDGMIMSSLKGKEMSKDQIVSRIQKLVTFPVDETIIQERIDRLERLNFITRNSNDDDENVIKYKIQL